ncbi:MAG: efflux RND transporter periplasmic adaptor subunit [Cyanothece sp. SIO2G6]|nr:efflux RND transporter periplasmic adaptor subunit [Cyanothece sp. SIO2G6]
MLNWSPIPKRFGQLKSTASHLMHNFFDPDKPHNSKPLDQDNLAPPTSQAPSWRSPRMILLTTIALGLGLVGLSVRYLRESPLTDTTRSPEVTTQAQSVTDWVVTRQPIQQRLEATGSVIAADLLPVLPKVTGLQIKDVLVEEGDLVTADQVLVTLDQDILTAQIQRQEAEVSAAQAAVRQQQAALNQVKAELTDAETNFQRFQTLESNGAISTQELDTRLTTLQTAQESVLLAEANIQSAEANVRSQQAQLNQLKIQLEQTLVRSPASGLIAERFARIGDVTRISEPLFRLIRDRRLELEVNLPETELGQIEPGTAVDITSDSNPTLKFQGRLKRVAPLIDPESRQARLKIDLPTSTQLQPGMFLRASFLVSDRLGVVVPSEAIVPQDGDDNVVYRLDQDNRAIAQSVELGEILDDVDGLPQIEIRSGLQVGDRIIVAGARYVNDGDRVQIVRK